MAIFTDGIFCLVLFFLFEPAHPLKLHGFDHVRLYAGFLVSYVAMVTLGLPCIMQGE